MSEPSKPPEIASRSKASVASPAASGMNRWFFLKLSLQFVVVFAAGIGLLLSLAGAQKMGWFQVGTGAAAGAGADQQTYTCPMHPQIRQTGPGDCPICGMALQPATTGSADRDQLSVTIEPAARRLANIQTAPVKRETVFQTVETVGSISFDESRLATVTALVEGYIEKVFADYTGVPVQKNDHLAVVYSPSLFNSQVAYVQSRRTLKNMGTKTLAATRKFQETLVSNSRQKLLELGMTEEQILAMEKSDKPQSRLTIYSEIGGTVVEKLVAEGQYVKQGQPIYRIANLSMVWLMLELFPEDAARIRFGQVVEAEVQSLPGESFNGRVAFIDPLVDQKTRTIGVRVEMLNEDGRLKPGDYASARIKIPVGEAGKVYDADLSHKWISPMHPQIVRDKEGTCPICGMDLVPTSRFGYSDEPVPQPTALVVPRDAVLMAGRNSVLYVETEPGRFELRPVALGPLTEENAVILSGVQEGEQVATSGNFLIDSQMQLAGKPSLIDPSKAQSQQPEKSGPLNTEHVHVIAISGKPGEQLEKLYAAYLNMQTTLADDKNIIEQDVKQLHQSAQLVIESGKLSKQQNAHLEVIVENLTHLHHLEIKEARERFREISRNILLLAATIRGEKAKRSLVQIHCPMVPGGGADWLQIAGPTANPFWGHKMLKCGSQIRKFPLLGHTGSPSVEERKKPKKP